MGGFKHLLAQYGLGGVVATAWELQKRLLPSPGQRRELAVFRKVGNPDAILDGPFAGMRYHRVVYAGSTLDRTLGVYEKEIHAAIERMVAWSPDVVADIGTSDGYYLVGMARRLPAARVVGYDTLPLCRFLTRRLLRWNAVGSRGEVRGRCDGVDLERVLSGARRPAVICDCDGGEDPVLHPEVAPSLKRAMIIVELHDVFVPGISAEIRRRFEGTHDVELIPVRVHAPSDVPPRFALDATDAADVVAGQRRMDNFWYLMTPRA